LAQPKNCFSNVKIIYLEKTYGQSWFLKKVKCEIPVVVRLIVAYNRVI
jgi:hypothetical protein